MKKLPLISIPFLHLFYVLQAVAATNTLSGQSRTNQFAGEVLLLTTSQACHCVLENCRRAEQGLKSILTNKKYEKIKFIRKDISPEPQAMETVFNKHQLYLVPIVVITDSRKKIFYKGESGIDLKKCRQTLDDILDTGRKR